MIVASLALLALSTFCFFAFFTRRRREPSLPLRILLHRTRVRLDSVPPPARPSLKVVPRHARSDRR